MNEDQNRANDAPRPAEERDPESKPWRNADPADDIINGGSVNPNSSEYAQHVAAKLSTKK